MKKIQNYTEFVDEKKSPYKKATLIKYKRKYEAGEEIPVGIENSLKAQGLIPRADGEFKVSDDYKTVGDSIKSIISPKSKKKDKESKEDSDDKKKPSRNQLDENEKETMNDAEVTLTFKDKDGGKVEVREIEGIGMAGEPMTFAYVYHDNKISTREKVKNFLSTSEFNELTEYLNDVSDNNHHSAVSYCQ